MYKTVACPCEYCRFDEFPDEDKKEQAD